MKNIIYFVLLIVLFGCYQPTAKSTSDHSSEDTEPRGPNGFIYEPDILRKPFQIAYAEQAIRLEDSINLAPLDYLSTNDTLQLKDSGYLILAHFSGFFLEFEGDTTLILSKIADSLIEELNIDPSKVKFRTNLELLYSKDQTLKACRVTAERSLPSSIEFTFPLSKIELSKNYPKLCISWESNNINVSNHIFYLKVKNIFDQLIDVIEVSGNKIELDFSEYNEEPGLFVINIESKNDRNIRSSQVGIKLDEQYYYFPNSCNFNSALTALEFGYHLENNHCYYEATEFYELASELSEHEIFKEFLNNHINRE